MKEDDIKLMRRIDEIYSEISVYGYRRIHKQLKAEGFKVGHNKVHRLMRLMNIAGLRPKRKRVNFKKENEVYPYLLKDMDINRPNQVWSGDITYIPVKNGYMYLCVVMDWYSKSVLAWNISNTMDTNLVLNTTQEAIDKYSPPEIFNSDRGSQYTSKKHTDYLKNNGIKISMNSKGRAIDNIVIERFFRTLKYEEIYIKEYENVKELKQGIKNFINFYNYKRFHSALGYDKPMNVYKKMLHKVA
jgi:putative transposase